MNLVKILNSDSFVDFFGLFDHSFRRFVPEHTKNVSVSWLCTLMTEHNWQRRLFIGPIHSTLKVKVNRLYFHLKAYFPSLNTFQIRYRAFRILIGHALEQDHLGFFLSLKWLVKVAISLSFLFLDFFLKHVLKDPTCQSAAIEFAIQFVSIVISLQFASQKTCENIFGESKRRNKLDSGKGSRHVLQKCV